MRDSSVFIDKHPLMGEKVMFENIEYTIGKILMVNHSRRLYVQMFRDSRTVNIPLHKLSKTLFDEFVL